MAASAVLAKKLVLITGKGGIGKTVVAASLAQAASESRRRVLLVESAATDQLAPLFGIPPRGHVITRVAPGIDCINLKPSDNFRDYVVKHLGRQKLFERVFTNRVVQSFINTVPGLGELMLLGRLYYEANLADEPRYDFIVFDGPASGHFMSLMTTPAAVLESSLGGPLAKETLRVKNFLARESECGILVVGTPEDLVVSECLDFLPRLAARAPAQLIGLAVNRVPARAAAARRWPSFENEVGAALSRRAASAQRALQTLTAGLKRLAMPLPVWLLPEMGAIEEPLAPGFGRQFLRTISEEQGGTDR